MPGDPPPNVRIDQTPNPNAVRCRLSSPIPPLAAATPEAGHGRGHKPGRSYRSAAEAEATGDGLAMDLFRLPGVVGVLIHESGAWFSVTKAPEAGWGPIRSGIPEAVRRALSAPAGHAVGRGPGTVGA
jgi:hypothetical protein